MCHVKQKHLVKVMTCNAFNANVTNVYDIKLGKTWDPVSQVCLAHSWEGGGLEGNYGSLIIVIVQSLPWAEQFTMFTNHSHVVVLTPCTSLVTRMSLLLQTARGHRASRWHSRIPSIIPALAAGSQGTSLPHN